MTSTSRWFVRLACALSVATNLVANPAVSTAPPALTDTSLHFEPAALADGGSQFIARGKGYEVSITRHETVAVLMNDAAAPSVIRMSLEGAAAGAVLSGEKPLAGRSNYLLGSDAASWRIGVPHFGAVRKQGVYPGVDLLYYGAGPRLEYDFIIQPGADYRQIRMSFSGASAMEIDAGGDLVLHAAGEVVKQRLPIAYQIAGGTRHSVSACYRIDGGRVVFDVGPFDETIPLVIDPILDYSTYSGSTGNDYGDSIAADSSGNSYVLGTTVSTNFEMVNAIQGTFGGSSDLVITKVDNSGERVFSTYFGGSGFESGGDIAVDSTGAVYVTGSTGSASFFTVNAADATLSGPGDAFILKLNPAGTSVVYSTYLGGSNYDSGSSIAVSSSGNVFVTGDTTSTDIVTVSAAQASSGGAADAFVVKLAPDGGIDFLTYLGGSGGDEGYGIAIDSSSNVYVTGFAGASFPVLNALLTTYSGGTADVFIAKYNQSGTKLFATYYGGSAGDFGQAIALDANANIYVAGYTQSSDLLSTLNTSAGGTDAFVLKFNTTGTTLLYARYFGGSANDSANDLAVSGSTAWITGDTSSIDLPVAQAFQAASNGGVDAFVAAFSGDGLNVIRSTYIGGSGSDYGNGIATGNGGTVHIAGNTDSNNFTTNTAFQGGPGGGYDLFIMKFSSEGLDYYVVTPCRALDTRTNGGALISSVPRTITLSGVCGVPLDAVAVITTVTVTQPTASGFVKLFPGDGAVPITSSINFSTSRTRANNALLLLAEGGAGTVKAIAGLGALQTVHLIVDVTGYLK